ncbi:hypothetical protein ACFLZ8_04055 [Planctomycetota bacterium]
MAKSKDVVKQSRKATRRKFAADEKIRNSKLMRRLNEKTKPIN